MTKQLGVAQNFLFSSGDTWVLWATFKLASMDKVVVFFLASIGLLALGGFLFNIKRETVFQSWRPNPFQIGGLTESH